MPAVIPVKFKYAAHDLWFDPADTGAQEGDHVICTTERSQEIGLATMDGMEVSEERLREVIGEAELRPVSRVADDADLGRADMLARKGDDTLPLFRRLVQESGLDMKPVGVEYLFGGGKVVCYFSSEERVDFRQLVKDLSRELHERIDMRQIGVREEAAIVGGYAHCGQELCCARFGKQFEPVSIRMAKEQDLPLNASKISGACGRLMCCLRYEFDAYRDFKQRAPKRNAVIDTPLGKAKIVEYDTPKEQICLRIENGKQVRIPLSDMVASEAACKKSEELHCPCRPDTVTRAALDRLESPDIQMALAELDRAHGIIPADEQGFDSSDIFVKQKPRRRRGHREGEGPAEPLVRVGRPHQQPKDADGGSSAQDSGRTRRRRKKSPAEAQETAADMPAQTTGRKRRHHRGKGQEGGAAAQTNPSPNPKPQTDAVAEDKPKRRRRRPGDHGGQRSQQTGPQQQPRAEGSPEAAGRPEGSSRSRRRRRRGGGGSGSPAAPAQGSGE